MGHAHSGKLTGSAYADQTSEPTAIAFSPDGRSNADYRGALQSAVSALQVYPWNPTLLTTLGIAQYRNGQYREALETLQRSDDLRGISYPTDSILIAMTHYRLGEMEKARKELKAAVPDRVLQADAQPEFFGEADALMAAGDGGH